jgi:hypothetical protein
MHHASQRINALGHLRHARLWLTFFILALVASGITAFPLRWEMGILQAFSQGNAGWLPAGFVAWIARVHEGVTVSYTRYPFLAYGTDWLAYRAIRKAEHIQSPEGASEVSHG